MQLLREKNILVKDRILLMDTSYWAFNWTFFKTGHSLTKQKHTLVIFKNCILGKTFLILENIVHLKGSLSYLYLYRVGN